MPDGAEDARGSAATPQVAGGQAPPRPLATRLPRLVPRRAGFALAALVLPAVLFLPGVLRGERFVSVLPVSVEPLRSERPAEAFLADRDAQWVTGDRLFPFLTDQLAVREELRAGNLPLWEPRLGLGMPLLAGTLAAPLYPPNALAVLLPPDEAAGLLALVALALGGLGMALFLARLGLSRGAVLAGVAALELGGFGLANLPYFMKVDAAVWIPWSLWAIEGVLAGRRWSGLALVLSTAFSLVAGFVPIAVFGLCLSGAWALARFAARARGARRPPHPPHPLQADGGEEPRAGPLPALARVMSFLVLGILAASAQLLPTAEASRHSARTGGGELLPQSLPDAVLWGLFVPDLFGGPAETAPAGGSPVAWWLVDPDELHKAELWNPLEWNAYALASAVLFALVALVATPRRAAFPALALALVFGFALGRAPARWLYAVPGLDLGAPGRVLALAWILWPWLAALGVEALVARRPRALPALCVGAFALAAASFVPWAALEPERWAGDLEQTLLARYGEAYDQTLETIRARLPRERSLAAAAALERGLSHTLGAALGLCAAAVVCALSTRRPPRVLFALGSAAVVVLACAPPLATGAAGADAAALAALGGGLLVALGARAGAAAWVPLLLCLCAEGVLAAGERVRGPRPEPGSALFPDSPTLRAVAEAAGAGRVLRYDASPGGVEELQRLARPGLLGPYGVSDLSAYVVFVPRTLVELAGALDPRMLARRHLARLADPALLGHPLLDLLGVSAVLSLGPLEHPRLAPVLERPGFHVYRREGAIAPARLVREARLVADDAEALAALSDPAWPLAERTLVAPEHAPGLARSLELFPPVPAEASAERWKPGAIEAVERPSRGRLELSVWGSSGGWLVVHEQYADGWRARVDGREVPVLRADHALRAVRVPRGESRVELWYAPRSVWLGAGASLVALGLALLGCALAPRRKPGL